MSLIVTVTVVLSRRGHDRRDFMTYYCQARICYYPDIIMGFCYFCDELEDVIEGGK